MNENPPNNAAIDVLDYRETKALDGGASFSRANRIKRIVWIVAWKLLAAWTPPPMHRWRVMILRLFGAKVHATAHVYGSAKVWLPSNLVMGAHACLGPDVNCYNMAMITMDEYAIVSQGAHLCASTHDVDDSNFQLTAEPITIGKRSWVAAEAFIGPGVQIADHSVVGARAVVFKDTELGGIYVGNPAKYVRQRKGR